MPSLTSPALSIYRGDTYSKVFSFQYRDTNDDLQPLDLTPYGDQWTGQLRKTEDATEYISFAVDTTQATVGVLTVSLTPSQTAVLPAKGFWDLQVVDTSVNPAYVRTMLKGTFVRVKDVTRP